MTTPSLGAKTSWRRVGTISPRARTRMSAGMSSSKPIAVAAIAAVATPHAGQRDSHRRSARRNQKPRPGIRSTRPALITAAVAKGATRLSVSRCDGVSGSPNRSAMIKAIGLGEGNASVEVGRIGSIASDVAGATSR